MNPDIKRRWIDALRSGDFQQTAGALHTRDDHYCCLGVLCELAVADNIIGPPVLMTSDSDDEWSSYVYGELGNKSTGFLPEEVAEWSGVRMDGGLNAYVTKMNFAGGSLAQLNDAGAPFPLIADIIEEHL